MKPNKNETPKNHDVENKDHSLKGTMFSVGFVLAFIIVSWVTIFSLYLSRV